MAIDYSKWDKIELSDDSDIEVHPNVDKNSFIKWKQRDIQEKRMQRNISIKSILVQLTMYVKLNKRVDYLLDYFKDHKGDLLDNDKVNTVVNKEFDLKEKFDYETLKKEKKSELRKGLQDLTFDKEEIENTPTYNEMIEDLFIQIKQDHPETNSNPDILIKYLQEHRKKIDDVLSSQTIRLDELLNEKAQLISSEDYHTGFDRSFMNKDEEEEEEKQKEKPKSEPKSQQKEPAKVTSTEVINTPSTPATDQELLDDLNLLPSTEKFGKIPYSDLRASADFLLKHTSIVNENQKDALIMTAFDSQLEGDSVSAKQTIHQSLLLQYTAQLAGPHPNKDQIIKAVKLFFSKIDDNNSPAKAGFYQDVENTFKHIETRCKVISQEQAERGDDDDEGEALIQLKALDEGTQLTVTIPQPGTIEYAVFTSKLSPEFQAAVKTGSLDEVNKEFAKMKVEDAETVLQIINECGVIGVDGYLENEEEFQDLKKQYNDSKPIEKEDEANQAAEKIEEINFNTVDEVD